MDDFCIRSGYQANLHPAYFPDVTGDLIYQPHVYELAAFLAERCGATHVVDVGCGAGGKLAALTDRFNTIGIDHGANLAAASTRGLICVAHDLESGLPEIARDKLANAVVICADVVEHVVNPGALLNAMSDWARVCPYVLISTPDRVLARGVGDPGPPANPAHVREWTAEEFDALLSRHGFPPRLMGHTINTQKHQAKTTLLAVAGREASWQPAAMPRILAIVNVYNEADMIVETIDHLLRQGVDVFVVDNWSTDESYALVSELAQREPRVRLKRFPEAPGNAYEWKRQLENVETLAAASDYDWILHNDADELRYAPWQGRTLAESIAFVDALGYNAIDFTVIDFRFLETDAMESNRTEERLRHFEFGRRPGHFVQVKAWRQRRGQRFKLAASGGHEIYFDERRIFPLKFLVKHYPLRSREQAARKIFRERLPRVVAERATLGWHTQYDNFAGGSVSGWKRSQLTAWGDHLFAFEYLVERLSGIGIEREEAPR